MNPQSISRAFGSEFRRMVWAGELKARYDEVAQEPVPQKFVDLLKRIDAAEQQGYRER